MAKVVHAAWSKLTGDRSDHEPAPVSISELIDRGESGGVEFKSTLRTNLHTGEQDDRVQMAALKTMAGFLNAKGGALLIGVADNGDLLGVGADDFASDDKMSLHLVNLVRDRIGDVFLPYIHPQFEEQDGHRLLTVRCDKGPKPAFIKDGPHHRFFVRGGNSTVELQGAGVTEYVAQRF
jgi:predicted HTH transcriptional regulator